MSIKCNARCFGQQNAKIYDAFNCSVIVELTRSIDTK